MDAYCTLVVCCVVLCAGVPAMLCKWCKCNTKWDHTHSLLIHTPLGMEVIREFLLVKHFENVNVVKHTVESSPFHQLLLRAYLGSKRI